MHLSPYKSLQVHQPSWTFYFLAPSICEMELNWPVSKGSPSSDVLGSDKLIFISLTGQLSFPRAGENWCGVRPGSNCKGEQHVLRAQCLKAESRCPSSTPSPFGTLAGLLPQSLSLSPGSFPSPVSLPGGPKGQLPGSLGRLVLPRERQ